MTADHIDDFENITLYHDYAIVYPNGDLYQIPMVTPQHIRDCKGGFYTIMDFKNNKDCIQGEWVTNKTDNYETEIPTSNN